MTHSLLKLTPIFFIFIAIMIPQLGINENGSFRFTWREKLKTSVTFWPNNPKWWTKMIFLWIAAIIIIGKITSLYRPVSYEQPGQDLAVFIGFTVFALGVINLFAWRITVGEDFVEGAELTRGSRRFPRRKRILKKNVQISFEVVKWPKYLYESETPNELHIDEAVFSFPTRQKLRQALVVEAKE